MKYLLTTIFIIFLVISPVRAAEYSYSQYCLRGFRDQYRLDEHYPEYAGNCADGSEFRGNIDDPELYTLAGTHYLRGESPASINWELQPLVKYLFGLFSFNPLLVQYLFAAGIVILLIKQFRLIGLIASLIFFLDGLTREQLSHTYLDLGQTFFILLFFYLLSSFQSGKDKIWPAMAALGAVALSKSFSVGLVVGGVGGVYLLLANKKLLKKYLYSLWLAVAVYILGYTAFFFYHPPLDFVTLHLDILRYYKSYVPEYPKGEIFRLIFTGQWRTWWDGNGLIPAPNWSLLWPVSLTAFAYAGLSRLHRRHPDLLPHLLWVGIYLLFISLRLVFPRYLLPILPSLYLILTSVILIILKKDKNYV